jgi:hypothetical protein
MSLFDSSKSKLWVAEYDLTADTVDIEFGGPRALPDVTTLADSAEALIAGLAPHPTVEWEGIFNDSSGRSDAILADMRALTGEAPISYFPKGAGAASVIGYSGGARYASGSTKTAVGNAVRQSASFDLDQFDYVKTLAAAANYTSTTSETSIDDSAATTAGFTFVVHVTVADDTYDVLLQDSADNSAWATVVTVSSGAPNKSRSVQTGTLRRYVRLRVVLNSATSVTLVAAYFRKA